MTSSEKNIGAKEKLSGRDLLGQDPAVFIVAGTNVAWGTPEYDFIGWMRGGPVEVTRGVSTDLPIPATAEVVLEGEMFPPEAGAEIEGPFGEASGYYGGGARPSAVTKIHTILYRDDPIVMGDPPLIVEGSGQNVLYSRSIDVRRSSKGWGFPESMASITSIRARSFHCNNPIPVMPCARRWDLWAGEPEDIMANGDRR